MIVVIGFQSKSPVCEWEVGCLYTNKRFSDTRWMSSALILTPSTQRSHQISQVKDSVPQDHAPHFPLPGSAPSPGDHLHFWLTGCRWEASTTSSLCLINLLEWLTELREAFHLLDHQLIINEYVSGTVDGRGAQDKAWGKGVGPSCAGCTPSLISNSSPAQKLLEPCLSFYGGFITQEQLNHWPLGIDSNFCLLPLPRGHEGWTESFNPLITWLVFWQSACTLSCGPKSPH